MSDRFFNMMDLKSFCKHHHCNEKNGIALILKSEEFFIEFRHGQFRVWDKRQHPNRGSMLKGKIELSDFVWFNEKLGRRGMTIQKYCELIGLEEIFKKLFKNEQTRNLEKTLYLARLRNQTMDSKIIDLEYLQCNSRTDLKIIIRR